ncbi:MAG: hypothetical protein GY853_03065 [PVC group bacterium]|nr:hypothetical protein [PVC group bacterium]
MYKRITISTVLMLAFIVSSVFAQVNPKLVNSLNEVLVLEIKAKRQCDLHRRKFKLAIPYHQIVVDKGQTIDQITDLIIDIAGTVDKQWPEPAGAALVTEAMNNDAYNQIELVQKYDYILSRFGHASVQRTISVARNNAMYHFMLLTNTAQKIIDENKINERLSK